MANHQGKEGLVKIGAVDISELNEWSFSESATTVDDTNLGDNWETCKPGTSSGSGSVSCNWDETDTTGQGALTVGAEVALVMQGEGATLGDVQWTCQAIITGIERSWAKDSIVPISYSWKANGPITEGTVA